jgi:hypothetical protein
MKCRDMCLEKFRRDYKSEWLLTFQKIVEGVECAKMLMVPFIGLLWLTQDRTLLSQRIWCPQHGFSIAFRVNKTQSQATINGGKAVRDNAFIDMEGAKVFT